MLNEFNNKRICFLNTCNREPYISRRRAHEKTVTEIEAAGFIIVTLVCEPNDSGAIIVEKEQSRYILKIPIEEKYDNLGLKLFFGYSYFKDIPILGILKIDDDVDIFDDCVFEDKLYTFDYFGAQWTQINTSTNGLVNYFAGPFYWVSHNAIKQIAEIGCPTIYEDVNVGLAIQVWKEATIAFPKFFQREIVGWIME